MPKYYKAKFYAQNSSVAAFPCVVDLNKVALFITEDDPNTAYWRINGLSVANDTDGSFWFEILTGFASESDANDAMYTLTQAIDPADYA